MLNEHEPEVVSQTQAQMNDEAELASLLRDYDPSDEAQSTEALRKKYDNDLFYWLQTFVFALVSIVLIFAFVCRVSRVVGSSMDKTLADGELLLVWSIGYQPAAGDIVVLNKTVANLPADEAIVKRVIATGGQTVDIDYNTSTVYVDGNKLEEPYLWEPMRFMSWAPQTHFEVPEDSVFVMGDNRNGSTDSRFDDLQTVHVDYVLGKAVVILFPFGDIGLI